MRRGFGLIDTLSLTATGPETAYPRARRSGLTEIFQPLETPAPHQPPVRKRTPKLQDLEHILRGDPRLRKKIRQIYVRLVPEISEARLAAKRKGLTIAQIKSRFETLGSASEPLIREYILEYPERDTASVAAKDIIKPYTVVTKETLDRYTRRLGRRQK
jgi:hypothetical protein